MSSLVIVPGIVGMKENIDPVIKVLIFPVLLRLECLFPSPY